MSLAHQTWIGDLPDGWTIASLRDVLTQRKELNVNREQKNILSVTNDRGVINYKDKGNIGNKASEDIERYKKVYKGDIVANSMNVIIGSVGISPEDGALSPVYIVMKPRPTADVRYYDYIFKAKGFQSQLRRIGYGILDHRMRIPWDNLKMQSMPRPPVQTQQKIADFLDAETAKIDNLIARQERLLQLLEEKRRATITHAVTRGLDPDVELKETNIPWLGQIPAHWEVVRVSRIFAENKDSNNDLGSLEPMKYKFGTIVPKNVKITEETQDELRRYNLIQPDDIMINGLNLNYDFVTQRIAVVEHYGCMTPAYISIRKRNSDVIIGYYTYLLKALDSQKVLNGWGTGIRLTLNYSELKKKEVLYPPIAEQSSIVVLLDSYIKKTSILESKIQTQIKLLKERRTSLISHVVTGKVKV